MKIKVILAIILISLMYCTMPTKYIDFSDLKCNSWYIQPTYKNEAHKTFIQCDSLKLISDKEVIYYVGFEKNKVIADKVYYFFLSCE